MFIPNNCMLYAYKGIIMNNLAEIVSSKARAEFFRILFGIGTNEYHLREIERRSGLAIGTIRQEAVRLERLGLIRRRDDGNRTYYSANREHPIYKEIHSIVLKTSGLADILRQVLTIDIIKMAFIFGSVATGNENPESDVDLFIVGDISLRALVKVLKEPSQQIGREINPHIMTLDEFEKRIRNREHFVKTVLESPILMIKGNGDELKRLGQ